MPGGRAGPPPPRHPVAAAVRTRTVQSGNARRVGWADVVPRDALSLLELGAPLGPDNGCTLETPFQNSAAGSASEGMIAGGGRPGWIRTEHQLRWWTAAGVDSWKRFATFTNYKPRSENQCAGDRTQPAAPLAYALIVERGPSPAPVVAAQHGGCGGRLVSGRPHDRAVVLSEGHLGRGSKQGSPSSVHTPNNTLYYSVDQFLGLMKLGTSGPRTHLQGKIARAAAKPDADAPESRTALSRKGGVILAASLGHAAGRALPSSRPLDAVGLAAHRVAGSTLPEARTEQTATLPHGTGVPLGEKALPHAALSDSRRGPPRYCTVRSGLHRHAFCVQHSPTPSRLARADTTPRSRLPL